MSMLSAANETTVDKTTTEDMKMRIHPNSASITIAVLLVLVWVSTGWAGNRFVDNGNETITDNATGLMWAKSVPSQKLNLSDAESYAKSSTLGGHKDWRVPTRWELDKIASVFPASVFGIKTGKYVTSIESYQHPGSIYVIGIYPQKRQLVTRDNGSKRYPFYVWLVRDTKKRKR